MKLKLNPTTGKLDLDSTVTKNMGWFTANINVDKDIDGATAVLADVINVLGTLIVTLKAQGLLAALTGSGIKTELGEFIILENGDYLIQEG